MMSRALLVVALMAGAAMAKVELPDDFTPGLCWGKYRESVEFSSSFDSVRFQSLNKAFVIVDEEVDAPTLVLYDNNEPDGLKSLNAEIEDGELLIGAANSDRDQCVQLRVPTNFDFDTIVADDDAAVTLAGTFTVPTLKLHIVNGYFLEANTTDTSIMVELLVLNNTGVGHHLLYGDDDSVADVELFNGGNGDAIFTGRSENGVIRHDGIGNVQFGKMSGNLEVFLTGQGDISVAGGSDLTIEGSIKHPYQVLYQEGSCDLEAIMGNALFRPCKQVSDDDLDMELTSIAG